MKKIYSLVAGLLLTASVWAQITSFAYTGSLQTYTVPAGVTSIQIETWGAEGGTGTYSGITPTAGLGGYAIGNLTVTPGQVLNVYVGGRGFSSGAGGYNGGGMAGTSYAAAGGGASDVRISPYGLSNRVIVGGGGGGAAFGSFPNDGGNGGGLIASPGETGGGFTGGGGGTQLAGGAAGCCYGAATGGLFGIGGGPGDYHNAGGGGGWYGGGSGAGQAGAGGGSSYIGGVTSGVTIPGIRTGNGQVIITVLCLPSTGTSIISSCTPITWIDGNTYSTSNSTATHTLTNVVGCDSIVTLNFTRLFPSTGTSVISSCTPITWIDGNTYSTSNSIATHTLTNAVGCDSIVTLNFTRLLPSVGTSVISSCNPITWIDGNTYSTSNTTATHTLTNVVGCDSIITLNFTLLLPSSSADMVTACDSYTWINGTTYTSSTTIPTFTLTNAAGCDSVVTLNLTINSVSDLTTALSGTTITANNGLATYQWLDCNDAFAIIPGQTTPSFTALANGSYAVQLTESGCVDTSACVVINSVGINEPSFAESFTVYPNPGNGKIFIQFNSIQTEVNLSLYSILGELIQQISVSNSSLIPYEMNVKSGIYLLKVSNSEHQEKTVRIIND